MLQKKGMGQRHILKKKLIINQKMGVIQKGGGASYWGGKNSSDMIEKGVSIY